MTRYTSWKFARDVAGVKASSRPTTLRGRERGGGGERGERGERGREGERGERGEREREEEMGERAQRQGTIQQWTYMYTTCTLVQLQGVHPSSPVYMVRAVSKILISTYVFVFHVLQVLELPVGAFGMDSCLERTDQFL